MKVPSPYLTYPCFGTGALLSTNIATEPGGGRPVSLYSVREVSASVDRNGCLHVYARGSMRKRDGGRGPNRGVKVDVAAEQPSWLAAIVADAAERLEAVNPGA